MAEYIPVVADPVGAPVGESSADVDFAGGACLEAGATYHVVFENLHPEPGRAQILFTGPVFDGTDPNEAWPCPACARTDVLSRAGDGTWSDYRRDDESVRVRMPHWCAALDGGGAVGQPVQYGYAAVDSRAAVYGTFRVRQRVRAEKDLPGPLALSFYARKVVGDAPLEVRVDGAPSVPVVVATPVPGVTQGGAFDWHTVSLEQGLEAGRTMAVEFSTGPDTAYELAAGVHQERACGAEIAGAIGGRAERSEDDGATWTGFTVLGRDDRSTVRLALYFARR